ncbi:response regulator [Clostridium sp.]|uniref:response regulator n=1 Tax=Clostridium sp. TaxID=1506 RepID=UPI00321714E0
MIDQTILIVDDNPDNIMLLTEILKDKYRLKIANNGEKALKIIESENPPNLILLDIMMPGMDGYAVCIKLKENPNKNEIPVIFTSALSSTRDIVAGFEAGGIDYITKPYNIDEVLVRVNTHLGLQKSKQEIQTLLSNTLLGSVEIMFEILTISNSLLVEKTNRLRYYGKELMIELNLSSNTFWEIDLAIMLSQIGCISVPQEILNKIFNKVPLDEYERNILEKHPSIGADLISKIPRLENVSKIVKNQLKYSDVIQSDTNDVVNFGSAILNLLITFDNLVKEGLQHQIALKKISMNNEYPKTIRYAFENVIKKEIKSTKQLINIVNLLPGMVLQENIYSSAGEIILPIKTELTKEFIDLLIRWNLKGRCSKENFLIIER